MRTTYRAALAMACAWATVIACGGKIDESATNPSDTSSGGGIATGTAPGGDPNAPPGSIPGEPPTPPPGAPPPPPPGTSSSGGSSSGGSSSGGPSTALSCGKATCNASTQVCCIGLSGGGGGFGTPSATCESKGSCADGVALSCTSSASCTAGQVCCLAQSGTTAAATCKSTCGGGPGGPGGPGGSFSIQLCASDKECKNGQDCEQTQLGIKICRPSFGP